MSDSDEKIKKQRGRTKMLILVFLANVASAIITDINTYLVRNHRIRDYSNLRGHLFDLRSEGLLSKTPALRKGLPNTYYLAKEFEQFRRLFQYLKDTEYIIAFMKSKYFNEYITSDDFQAKFVISIFKSNLLKAHAAITNDDSYRALLKNLNDKHVKYLKRPYTKRIDEIMASNPKLTREEAEDTAKRLDRNERGDHENLLQAMKKIRNHDTSDERIAAYYKLVEDLQNNDIDAIAKILDPADKTQLEAGKEPDSLKLLLYAASFILPQEKMGEIIDKLKKSPSAVDFMLNPEYHDPGIMAMITSYVLKLVYLDSTFFKLAIGYDTEDLWTTAGDATNPTAKKYPLLKILECQYTYDATHDKLIK